MQKHALAGEGSNDTRSHWEAVSGLAAPPASSSTSNQAVTRHIDRAPKWFWGWLVLMTVLALVTRFAALDQPSVYLDELFSVRDAAGLVQQPLNRITGQVKILGYVPVALGLWAQGVDLSELPPERPEQWRAAGVHPFGMRVGPALVGVMAVPLLGWVSLRLMGTHATAVLLLLLALAPWHIYWSQASRFYIAQFLLYSVALMLYYHGSRDSIPRRSLFYLGGAMAAMVLAFMTQFTSGVLVFVIAADWLATRLRGERLAMGKAGYALVVMSTLICTGLLAMSLLANNSGWSENMSASEATPVNFVAKTIYFIGPAVIVIAGLTFWGRLGASTSLRHYLIIAAVLPILIFALLSFRSYSGSRYAFPSLFPWLALAALGLSAIYNHLRAQIGHVAASMPLALVLVAMMVMNASYYVYNPGFRPQWKEAMARMGHLRQPDERIYSDRVWVSRYYLQTAAVEPLPRVGRADRAERPAWFLLHARDPGEIQPGRQVPANARFEASYLTVALKPLHCVYLFHATVEDPPDSDSPD